MHTSALPAVIPVLLIGSASLLTPVLTPRTVQFGVRVPAERAGDQVVAEARRTYWIGIGAVTVVAALVGWFAGSVATATVGALLVELVGTTAVYLVARSHIAGAKQDGRWFEGRTQITVTDTTLRTRPEPFPWLWTLPGVAVTVGTAVVGAIRYPHMPERLVSHYDAGGHPTSYTDKTFVSAFGLVGVQIGITVLIVGVAWVTAHGKADLDVQDPRAADRHRRFVTVMARCVLVLAAAADLTMLLTALAMWGLVGSTGWFPVLLIAPVVVATAGLVVVAVRVGQGGSRLRLGDGATSGGAGAAGGAGSGDGAPAVNRDDDRYWKLGMFYVNREDPSVFVQKRFGIGWTVNFGRPAAVGFFVAILVVVAVLPIILRSR